MYFNSTTTGSTEQLTEDYNLKITHKAEEIIRTQQEMFPVCNFPSSKCLDIKNKLLKSRQDLEGQDKSLIELFEEYSEQKIMSSKF